MPILVKLRTIMYMYNVLDTGIFPFRGGVVAQSLFSKVSSLGLFKCDLLFFLLIFAVSLSCNYLASPWSSGQQS